MIGTRRLRHGDRDFNRDYSSLVGKRSIILKGDFSSATLTANGLQFEAVGWLGWPVRSLAGLIPPLWS